MRILVTRPVEDANATAAILRARGHEPVIAPLTEIRHREDVEVSMDGVQAILATSANGIRALGRKTPRRDVRVFAVGSQTGEAARAADFLDVQNADGDVSDLIQLVIDKADRQHGVLLHAAGSETRGDLASTLHRAGFSVQVATLYDAIAASALSAHVTSVDVALFYSPRSAALFSDLARRANCSRIIACCISAATADALKPLHFREIRVAGRPNQESLLALLE